MKKNSKRKIFIAIFILILICATFYLLKNNDLNIKNNDNKFHHSSTMNIKVIDKSKNTENYSEFSIKVKNSNEPFQEYSIVIKDEKLWNLINLNESYFVNVSWKSTVRISNISGQNVTLLQIEKFK